MEKSESIKELANALCKFQAEVEKIKKERQTLSLNRSTLHLPTFLMSSGNHSQTTAFPSCSFLKVFTALRQCLCTPQVNTLRGATR